MKKNKDWAEEAVKEIGNFTIEQTGSGVIILTPIKKIK